MNTRAKNIPLSVSWTNLGFVVPDSIEGGGPDSSVRTGAVGTRA